MTGQHRLGTVKTKVQKLSLRYKGPKDLDGKTDMLSRQ